MSAAQDDSEAVGTKRGLGAAVATTPRRPVSSTHVNSVQSLIRAITRAFPSQVEHDARVLDRHLREGRFQRSLSLVAGVSGLLSGLEVASQHYRGSYGQRIMYSPVVLSSALFAAGVGGAVSPRWARTALPVASAALVADGVLGFGFHIRGIARKPGGWRIPVFNIVMGPPIFAPLLLTVGGGLGLVASMLRPESSPRRSLAHPAPAWVALLPALLGRKERAMAAAVREGRFQQALGVAMAASAVLNGFESLYSHYKTNFAFKVQWAPVLLTPALTAAGLGTVVSPKFAKSYLPAISLLAVGAGGIGFFYHLRGVMRRPGSASQLVHNPHLRTAPIRAVALCRNRVSRAARQPPTKVEIMSLFRKKASQATGRSAVGGRADALPAEATRWPVDPRSSAPLEPRAQPGYYPDFSTLSQQDFWDATTRDLIVKRVHEVPPVRFFSPLEEPIARAVFDRIVPQDDRDDAHKIPVVNYVDAKLYERRLDGYRFDGVPDAPRGAPSGAAGDRGDGEATLRALVRDLGYARTRNALVVDS